MSMKFSFLTVGIFIASIANAQINKGTALLGGNIQFGTTSSKAGGASSTNKETDINIAPSLGVAVKNNLVIGGTLVYGYSNKKDDDPSYGNSLKTNNYGAGFFVRRYKDIIPGIYVFAEGNLLGLYQRQKGTNNADPSTPYLDAKGYTITTGFYPGIAFNLGKKFMIEGGFQNLFFMQYAHGSTKYGLNDTKQNQFLIGTGLNSTALAGFTVGFRFLL
ncbi:MAG TPA: hypothetical protein VHC48_18860 [Puia sp.]|nr:hypothetical protein [Puia sp.]